ncbi:hypothetical protein F5Y17DRAFT_454681 [Xylariaceae sp. FL0594]|nr:hypothetical protein F5Y17DRAFT_454681 [Xylariaceae sp. FL0594]
MKLSPPSPRDYLPSRAHPEHRKHRKQLEKEHPFGFKEFAVLGLIGLTLAWDIEKQVEKREQRKDKERERKEGGEDETRRRSSRSRRDEKDEDGDRRTERRARSTTTTGVGLWWLIVTRIGDTNTKTAATPMIIDIDIGTTMMIEDTAMNPPGVIVDTIADTMTWKTLTGLSAGGNVATRGSHCHSPVVSNIDTVLAFLG